MNTSDANLNNFYDDLDTLYNPARSDRSVRRKRKPRANPHDRRRKQRGAVQDMADLTERSAAGLEVETTYTPSRYEAGWLMDSLRPFFDMALIDDVLAQVKGGKEASVYRCLASPDSGLGLVAAKVYRPRMFRQLRKDHVYRQGREVLTTKGRPVGLEAERVSHAIQQKTAYGRSAAHTSWLMYEHTTLQMLYNAGAVVPQPLAAGPNALLMGYVGDERTAAPTLHEVTLEPDEVEPLFAAVLHNIELMLRHNVIHGDLSAYNILYWDGAITLIDFPQVVDPDSNPQAYDILRRDVTRVCQYFARYGINESGPVLADRLWRRYAGMTPQERAAHEALFLLDEIDLADENGDD